MGLSVRFLIGLGEPSKTRPVDSSLEWRSVPSGAQMYGDLPQLSVEGRAAERERRARRILTQAYDVGSFFKGEGIWHDLREDSLMFETILHIGRSDIRDRQDAEDKARDLAKRLCNVLGQDAVGLVFTPVDFELVEGAA